MIDRHKEGSGIHEQEVFKIVSSISSLRVEADKDTARVYWKCLREFHPPVSIVIAADAGSDH